MQKLAASRLVMGPFDEGLIRETVVQLRGELAAEPTFALLFITPDYADRAAEMLELVRVYGHVATVVGCSGERHRRSGAGNGGGFRFFDHAGLPARRERDRVAVRPGHGGWNSGPEFWRDKAR